MPNATTIREAVLECFRAHGDAELPLGKVEECVAAHYSGRWSAVYADVSGLVMGATDGSYRATDQFLHRVRRGVYRLDEAYRVLGQPTAKHRPPHGDGKRAHVSTAPVIGAPLSWSSQTHHSIWVEGIPSVWGTKAEGPWREILGAQIPCADADDQACRGVQLRFSLESNTRAGQPFDLDNLCEPVFRVLVNERGHFGGKRPNVKWWSAIKRVEEPPGCAVIFGDEPESDRKSGRTIFEGVYQGQLPKRGSDTGIAKWLEAHRTSFAKLSAAPFAVSLLFGSARINIADVSTGPTKSIIDNLFPIIGGAVSRADDWRIQKLFVQKECSGFGADEMFLRVAALDAIGF